MNRTRLLRDIGQSLWLDNITRDILDNGALRRYIDEYCVTGLTSNPTIFDQAIGKHRAQRSIEIARHEPLEAAALLHIAHETPSVTLAIGQRQQHLEDEWFQWKQVVDRCVARLRHGATSIKVILVLSRRRRLVPRSGGREVLTRVAA